MSRAGSGCSGGSERVFQSAPDKYINGEVCVASEQGRVRRWKRRTISRIACFVGGEAFGTGLSPGVRTVQVASLVSDRTIETATPGRDLCA